jgi:prepilin peptidase CpaA
MQEIWESIGWWENMALCAVLLICVTTDIRSRRIYNKVVFPAMAGAVVMHAALGGWEGLAHSLLGFAVGLGILLVPFLMGGMGAGDVKLLALIGTIKGAAFVLSASVYIAIAGAVMALFIVLFAKGFKDRMRYVMYVLVCVRYRLKLSLKSHLSWGAYPYGVAIAVGSLLLLVLREWGVT